MAAAHPAMREKDAALNEVEPQETAALNDMPLRSLKNSRSFDETTREQVLVLEKSC